MKNEKKGFNLISVIIVICITSIISGLTTGVIVTNSYKNNLGLTYDDLKNDESLNEFLEVYSSIINNYYEDVDTSAMIDSAVDGMLDYLGEDYTTYLDQNATSELEERLAGSYRGIGIAVANKVIQSITSGTPAAESGLQVGDTITGVDGVDALFLRQGDARIDIEVVAEAVVGRQGEEVFHLLAHQFHVGSGSQSFGVITVA